jgi:hypothetical protein
MTLKGHLEGDNHGPPFSDMSLKAFFLARLNQLK